MIKKTSIQKTQKGTIVPGIILLVFFIMIAVLAFVTVVGKVKEKFDGPCNWVRALDAILSSGFANNLVCNVATGQFTSGGTATGGPGNYTYSGRWNCSGSAVDPTSIKDPQGKVIDPTKAFSAFDAGAYTVIYQYPDGSDIGYVGGSRAWRNNNPGNVTKDVVDTNRIGDDGTFAIFNNSASGQKAMLAQTTQTPGTVTPGKIIDSCLPIAPVQLTASNPKNITSFANQMNKAPGQSPDLEFDENFGNALLSAIAEAKSSGIEISIISGYRDEHNHKLGMAADIHATRQGVSICEQSITANKNAGRANGHCDQELIAILDSYGLRNAICIVNVAGFNGGHNDGDCSHFSYTGG